MYFVCICFLMFLPVVCVTCKSAVDLPFVLVFQGSNCTGGGVCSTPLCPLRNCSISISTSVKSSFGALFPASMFDFLACGHGSWKRGADAARNRPSPHTCTQCNSFLFGATLWPAQDLNSFFSVCASWVCPWQKCCGPPRSVDFAAFKLHRRGGSAALLSVHCEHGIEFHVCPSCVCHWQKCCGPPLSVDFAAFKLHRRGCLQHSRLCPL